MRKTYIIAVAALITGVAIGHYGFGYGDNSSAKSGEKEILYWVAPMDPNFRRDKPGKSPMGMDLIPVYEGDGASEDNENALELSPAVVNNIGVRKTQVTVSDLHREINTVGIVTLDETKTSHVHIRASGWIEKLNQKTAGEHVKKGDVLFEIYSPEIVAAQSEYLQAIGLHNKSLTEAAKSRLSVLGMTESDIASIKANGKTKDRVSVLAPQDGIILDVNVGEGMYVTSGLTIFSLADLSTIWVQADVFEAQAEWVQVGQAVKLTLPYTPGDVWEGRVKFIYPRIDTKSRTVQVRLEFNNKDNVLKPNMYGEVEIASAPIENALSIPREALIRTGKTDRVILALGDGKFRPAEVIAGTEVADRVVIENGLTEGEEIVTSGQFLIDSEASITGAFLRMMEEDTPGMDMDMSMDDDEPGGKPVHHGMGTVVSISEDGSVTLTHDPIDSLGWPSMTMDFSVADGVDISMFEAGDRMHFMIVKTDEGPFIITTAMKM